MSDKATTFTAAAGIMRHYIETALTRAGVPIDPDMRVELDVMEDTFKRLDRSLYELFSRTGP